MKKQTCIALLLSILICIISLSACGGGGGGSDPTPSPPPTTTGSMRVTNNTGATINNLYISPSSSSSWGPDQLGSSTLGNGSSVTINSIPAGSYDVKAVLANGTTLYHYSVSVVAGQTLNVAFP